ncbi:MAG: DUF4364 family protein [Clostridium sp.]|uniref:DUF4364 family protein n=1 Tax=Clostridium sp. TaxID=1506 RepID=UPI0025BFD4A6|nr:DUF4364 family protein [Clostridium sp.]MCH3962817.1 DUF4364 family protein [Clostridium sp.]MCI1715768.1 DUF4364 family protein [Clostridium sp.]MCI1800027.1 DUF4364 family protein [Clostridium sp.]MCI1813941.1 DUF4364 family protein [Clostridium sp.]MCI1870839.1 DUF4364 family protein [Clostridium sp.]
MSENTLELAENKLLLLYIFKKISIPVSNNKITQIILENNLINYFVLQQYIGELLTSKFIEYVDPDTDHKMEITKKGIKVLDLFENMISADKIQTINEYLEKHIENIKKNISVSADYVVENKNNFMVDLSAVKDGTVLMNIKLCVNSSKEADKLCHKWKSNYSDLYYRIIQLLLEK